MINTAQDVLDSENDIGTRDLAAAAAVTRRAVELRRGLGGGERVDAALAVEPDHLHHGGGVALAHAVDRQRALEAIAAAAQGAGPGGATLGPVRDQIVSHRALVAR